jgi:hypothetical protein
MVSYLFNSIITYSMDINPNVTLADHIADHIYILFKSFMSYVRYNTP